MNNWTAADFLTYIYHLVADSDFKTEEEEINILMRQISKVISRHFGVEKYSYFQSLKKIQETEGVSMLNCKTVIKELWPRFDFSKAAREDILNDLEAIVVSDSKITPSERETMDFLKEVLLAVEMPLSW